MYLGNHSCSTNPCLNYLLVFLPDPHIKVSGEPESVKRAKEKIMAVLDTKVKADRPVELLLLGIIQ